MLTSKQFEHLYQLVSIAGAAGVSVAHAAMQTGYSEADISSAFSESSAFTASSLYGNFVAVDTYVSPTEEARVDIDSLAELFPEPQTAVPETDELVDWLNNNELSDGDLSDLEYTARQTGEEFIELATKYSVDASNAGFYRVRQKLAVIAAILHKLRTSRSEDSAAAAASAAA